jgi:hypothetical protein
MLLRYVALGKINIEQLPTALFLLSKAGGSLIDQEEFEKDVGIGKFADVFGFSEWKVRPSRLLLRPVEMEAWLSKLNAKVERRTKEEEEKKHSMTELV